MKPFAVYTLARLLMFVGTWAVVWLVASFWLDWTSVTALWTALVSLAVSSLASYRLLRGPRERLAEQVEDRAARLQQRYDAAKRKEDVDGD